MWGQAPIHLFCFIKTRVVYDICMFFCQKNRIHYTDTQVSVYMQGVSEGVSPYLQMQLNIAITKCSLIGARNTIIY